METTAVSRSAVQEDSQILLFKTVITIAYAFLPAMSKSLHVILGKICTSGGDPLNVSIAEKHHALPFCAHIHCLVSTFSKHQWMSMGTIFSAWRNSIAYFCFICISMSDAVLSDCSSASIGHRATKCNKYWQKGSTSTVKPLTSAPDVMGQHNKTGGVTFRAALIFKQRGYLMVFATDVSRRKGFSGRL